MAINQNSIWNLKYILCITFVFCLFSFTPVACTTEYFEKSATQQYHDDFAGTFQLNQLSYTDILMFNDIDTLKDIQSIILKVDNEYWLGSSDPSQWEDVEYHLGSDTGPLLGTGTFGYNNGSGYIFIIATFDEGNTFGDYSGTQKVHIVGGPQVRFGDSGAWTSGSTTYDASSPTMVHFGYYFTGGGVDHAACASLSVGNATTSVYTGYDFINSYTYYNDNLLNKLDVTRTGNQSIWTVERGGEVIAMDTDYSTTDLPVYDNDLDNSTWDIMCNDSYGNTYTDTIDMTYTSQEEDTIEWGEDSYVVDDTGSYSWVLSDSNWDTVWYSKKASIYRDETMVHEVSLPAQTGTFYYTFEEEGTFTVKLRKTSALLPHVTIDTDTVSVTPMGESFIGVTNTTVYINTPIEFQFSYGFTPLPVSPGVWSSATSIEARKLINGDWVTVNRWFYPDLDNVTPSVLYTYTIGTTGAYSDSMLTSEGEYIFYLTDFNHGDVASTNVYTVEYQSGMPTENITTTYLNILSGETYLFDDLFTFKYGIDNTNFTNGINYIEIYNYDHDIITQSALLFKQSWYKDGYIFPMTDEDPTEQFQYGIIIAFPGNNTMRIRHDDINGSTELLHDNFTLSENNIRGYGLRLSAYEACINEAVTIWVTIPSDSNLTIYSPTGTEIKTYNLNASTTITYYFPVFGQYDLKLVPSGLNYAERTATIYISDCADDGIIEPPSGEMDDMYLNMFNFMTLPIFWGMIIFVGFIGGLAMKTNRLGDHLVSGNGLAFIAFGLLNLLAFIGMLAPYTMYAIVSTWIFAGMFFGVGRYLARGE